VRLEEVALQGRERAALEIGQGRGRLGARGRLGGRCRRRRVAPPHQHGARHAGHLAVAGRQGVLDSVHVTAQAVQLARGAQAAALLKDPDHPLQVPAMA
jgi:hypothetical protein